MKRLPQYKQQGRAINYSVSALPLELYSYCSVTSYREAADLEETRRLSVSQSVVQASQVNDWQTLYASSVIWRWASTSSSTK